MKVGQRVYAALSLHRTGVRVSEGERGTVAEVAKGRSFSIKTGFGRERHRSSDRVLVQWDNGERGWADAEYLR